MSWLLGDGWFLLYTYIFIQSCGSFDKKRQDEILLRGENGHSTNIK